MTTTADMSNSVVAEYKKNYFLMAIQNPGVWKQFVAWQPPIPADGGGASSYDFPVYDLESDLVESSITSEDSALNADVLTDFNLTMTPAEWGKLFKLTRRLKYQSRTKLTEIMAKVVTANRVNSIDRVLRRAVVGYGSSRPTMTLHVDASAAMTSLASGDTVTLAWLQELQMHAQNMGMEPIQGLGYVSIIPYQLEYDLKQLTEWKNVSYYQDKKLVFTDNMGQAFQMGGITFIPSKLGRLYLGSGTTAQAATSLSAAANRKATTVTVASASGLAVGDYITIGTIETESVSPGSNLEQVQITGVNSTTLTIRGMAQGTSFGLRFDHAAGEAVNEAANVAAIPLIGKESLIGASASDVGVDGEQIGPDYSQDPMKRVGYWGWYWYGALGVQQKRIILGKCATSKGHLGYN